MQDDFANIRTQEQYDEYVRKALEEAEREAADPNTRWIPWREVLQEGDAYLCELERRYAAKSA